MQASGRTKPLTRVEVSLVAVAGGEGGVAPAQRRAVEPLVGEAGLVGGVDGGGEESRHAVAGRAFARSGQHQQAVLGQQLDAGLGLERAPDLVAARGEGRVFRPLAAGDAGDAGVAVRRAEGMRRIVLVDAQHPRAALRQLVGGGGAHRAQPENDRVDCVRHRTILPRRPFALQFGAFRHTSIAHDDSRRQPNHQKSRHQNGAGEGSRALIVE